MTKKILIVEDSPEYLFVLDMILRAKGIQTELAPTYNKALEMLGQKYDLILVDYLLDEKDGLMFIEEMRKRDIFKDTPTFLLTTQIFGSEGMFKINQLKANYIQKPIAPHALLKKISEHLGGDGK